MAITNDNGADFSSGLSDVCMSATADLAPLAPQYPAATPVPAEVLGVENIT
jgi:hypothetical protein